MHDLPGFLAIFFVILFTFVLAAKWPTLSKILFVALILRVLVIFFDYVFGSFIAGDAISFYKTADLWSQSGLYEALGNFTGFSSYSISWILAIIFSLFGSSIILGQSISLLFGMGTVLIGCLLAEKLWEDGNKTAVKVGWVLALFPTQILYSTVILREAYICFFLLIALYGVVDWAKSGKLKAIIIGVLGFTGATFFHGAMIIGLFMFLAIILKKVFTNFFKRLRYLRLQLYSFFLIIIISFCFIIYVFGNIYLPKIGTFASITSNNSIIKKLNKSTRSLNTEKINTASYPQWTAPKTYEEVLYKGPVRTFYFLFSPFPWQLKKLSHLVGLLDGLLYVIIMFMIWKNKKTIWSDPALRTLALIIGVYIIVFAFFTGNFGTALRHRTKFIAGLLLLAGPKLWRFVIKKKS